MQQPAEIDTADDEPIVDKVAGIDVAKASGMVCTRVPAKTGSRRVTRVWEVASDTAALIELADHLVAKGIERVVLESTSDYWRPFFYVLAGRGLSVWLVNAAQVKNVPGRPKTDKLDAVWLAKLAEKSMVSPSFVPAEPMRHVRDLARARYDLVGDRTRVKQRIEKLLEDALIKLSVVLSDIHGVTGRAIIEALIAGTRDPIVLAGLAKGRAKSRHAELVKALNGRFTGHHAAMARMLLNQADEITAHIDHVTALLDEAIAVLPAPSPVSQTGGGGGDDKRDDNGDGDSPAPGGPDAVASAVERLSAIPGVKADAARAIIGEIGLDMSVFGDSKRLCAWAKTSPRTVQSGRKHGKAKTGKGNRYLKAALGNAAMAAGKTDTFLGERYRRLIKRMPKPKAKVALERSMLVIIFHLLADPTAEYVDLGSDYYQKRVNKTRRTRQLTHQLETLGYHVTLAAAAA